MVRPLRIEYPGATYHITSRGNQKKEIFLDDQDYQEFLAVLNRVSKTYNWICHAYCLMPNHYHLVIETPDGNLSAGMRDLNGIYTQKFNKRHNTVGHIFQGRFKAFLIEKEPYLLRVIRYTVLNAVRAGLAKRPGDWPWDSYRATLGLAPLPDFLEIDWVLNFFHHKRSQAQQNYSKFVFEGIGENSPFSEIEEGILLGSPQFSSEMWEQNEDVEALTEVSRSERMLSRPLLQDLFEEVGDRNERDEVIKFARLRCGYSVTDIADYLNLHRTTVSRIINKI